MVRQALIEQLDLAECRFEVPPFDVPLVEIDRPVSSRRNALRYENGGFALPPRARRSASRTAAGCSAGWCSCPSPARARPGPNAAWPWRSRTNSAVAAARNPTLHPLT